MVVYKANIIFSRNEIKRQIKERLKSFFAAKKKRKNWNEHKKFYANSAFKKNEWENHEFFLNGA